MFLFGRFLREKDNRKNASILIFTTDKKSDLKETLKEARTYLETRKKGKNAKYKFMPAQEGATEAGESEAVGDRQGRMVELKVAFVDEPKRYLVLAAVHHDDKAYIIRCDCAGEPPDLAAGFSERSGDVEVWQQRMRPRLVRASGPAAA